MDVADPFRRLGPDHAETPLVCAVPHAGRLYPPALLRDAAVPRAVLEQLEDRHADGLVAAAVMEGAVAIVAATARAVIDLNRAPDEIDPAMAAAAARRPSARVASGLGLIPRRLGARELWRCLPDAVEVEDRLARIFRPYHHAIAVALGDAVATHGFAVLLECHSMPSLRGGATASVVVGDRHGRSAGRAVTDAAVAAAGANGLRVARNSPYAGAYALDRHGRPAANVHAVQVEFDRALYLDDRGAPLTERVGTLARLFAAIGQDCVDAARPAIALAAE